LGGPAPSKPARRFFSTAVEFAPAGPSRMVGALGNASFARPRPGDGEP